MMDARGIVDWLEQRSRCKWLDESSIKDFCDEGGERRSDEDGCGGGERCSDEDGSESAEMTMVVVAKRIDAGWGVLSWKAEENFLWWDDLAPT
jgi:hypothetical protein